jgi:hypothetical protein
MAKPETVAAIKAKFPGANLSKKRLEQIADKLETKITEENDVNAAIDAYNEYNSILEIAKNDDRMRQLEKDLAAAKKSPSGDQPPTDKDDSADADQPKWVKDLMANQQRLAAELDAFKTEKSQQSIHGKASSALADVPGSFWNKRALPGKEDEVEGFVAEVRADYDAFMKENTEAGINMIPVPGAGKTNSPAGPKGISPSIKALFPENKGTQPAPALNPAMGKNYTLDNPQSLNGVGV